LALSEVIGLIGKRPLPVLPPWGAGLLTGPLRQLGLRIPDEVVHQLRFGRATDNRLFKATGFRYGYTTRETVLKLAEHQRLASVMHEAEHAYTYEREVEEFLRWSPHVRRDYPGERGGVASDREPLGI
jgi:UDP-glucose 4-epimerase